MMELPDHIMPVTWGTLTQIGTHQSEHCSYVANKQASSATGNAPIILNQNDLNWRHIGDNHHYILLAIFLASICIWGLMKQITYKFLIVIKQIRQHKKRLFWSGIEQYIDGGIITTKKNDNFSSIFCRKVISRWNAITPISYAKEGIKCLPSNWHAIDHGGLINSLSLSHTKRL